MLWMKTKIRTLPQLNLYCLFVLFFFFTLLFSVCFPSSASAINFYGQPQKLSLRQHNSNWIRFSNDNNQDVSGQGASGFSFSNNQYTRTFTSAGHLTKLSFYWNNNIPEGSYFYTFDINFHSDTSTFYYYGLESQYSGKVFESCRDSSGAEFSQQTLNPVSSTGGFTGAVDTLMEFHELSCHYMFYSFDILDHFTSIDYAKILTVLPLDSSLANFGLTPSVTMTITGGSYYPMTWDSLTDNDRSFLNGIKSEISAVTDAVESQTEQEHDDYEDQKQREEDKEDELNETKSGLSISAQNTGNPFASLFTTSSCVNMPTVGGWFGRSDLRICSPYPQSIQGVIDFVGSAIVVGLLVRLYYKKLKGGVDG